MAFEEKQYQPYREPSVPPTPASRNTGLVIIIILLLFAIFHGPIIAFFRNLGQPDTVVINPTPSPYITPPAPTPTPTVVPTLAPTPTPVIYRTNGVPQTGPADGLVLLLIAALGAGSFAYYRSARRS